MNGYTPRAEISVSNGLCKNKHCHTEGQELHTTAAKKTTIFLEGDHKVPSPCYLSKSKHETHTWVAIVILPFFILTSFITFRKIHDSWWEDKLYLGVTPCPLLKSKPSVPVFSPSWGDNVLWGNLEWENASRQ